MKHSYILSTFIALAFSLSLKAQRQPERLIFHEAGTENKFSVPMEALDSIVFSDEDKELEGLSLLMADNVKPGELELVVHVTYGQSVGKVLGKLVPCSVDDELGLLKANMLTEYIRNPKSFTEIENGSHTFKVKAGTYRAFVVALDEEGNFCDSGISSSSISFPKFDLTHGYYVYGNQMHETDMNMPLFMIAQSELLGDMYPGQGANTGYDWYRNYSTCVNVGPDTYLSYIPWRTLEKQIQNCNNIIRYYSSDPGSNTQVLGTAYAYRALFYYTYMYLWEPVGNKYTDVSNVRGLTVPIVTEETTAEQAANNPRATHRQMTDFILSDLDKAEELLSGSRPATRQQPSLACIYGMRARVYMWDEDYRNAARCASEAINAAGGDNSIIYKTQWLDLKTGFNTDDNWMWSMRYNTKDGSNLANFTGWMSGETVWGYNSLVQFSIDRSLYEKIAYTDFRKFTFIDPEEYVYDYQTVRQDWWLRELKPYVSLKFRCAGGEAFDYEKGAAVALPLMRIEELYFIQAEALAHCEGVEAGVNVLNTFMRNHRDPAYSCTATTLRDFQLENLLQMRIEFWGEGTAFPMAKRIRPGVMQSYEGTNAPSEYQINCEGIKPNWNFVIPSYAIERNRALEGQNNPDPSGIILVPSNPGQYQ